MISVAEAKQYIKESVEPGNIISISLYDAYSFTLANDLFSSIDFPHHDQSAMDGYAFRFQDWKKGKKLFVEREMKAGDGPLPDTMKPNEAIRIYTGAFIPSGADTIVMQEHASLQGSQLFIENNTMQLGDHVRPKGSQTNMGECILKKGTVIRAGMAGLLAGLGIHQLNVYRKPICSILCTGNELIQQGEQISEGKIFESNSYALALGLKQIHVDVKNISIVDDDLAHVSIAIKEALEDNDILLLTGGVSVGNYDFVIEALAANEVKNIFHKVKQKPGKPLYFGMKGKKIIFGLPGNPASVLTCFYEYVTYAIQLYMGNSSASTNIKSLPITHQLIKKSGLTQFLKAKITPEGITSLQHQESYKMNAFAEADAFIIFPEEATELKTGDLVEVHLLNQ